MSPRLPLLARILLRAAPSERRDELAGDLLETHAVRRSRGPGWVATASTCAQAATIICALQAESLRALPSGLPLSAPEIRLALRTIVRQPALTITATLAMATAIGLATAGFDLYHTVASARLPFDRDGRWVVIQVWTARGAKRGLDPDGYRAIERQAKAFAHVGAYRMVPLTIVRGPDEVEVVRSAQLTPASMRLLPFAPLLGRTLIAADATDTPRAAVVRESYWRRSLGARADVLGRTLPVAGGPITIVGVLPDDASFPGDVEVWTALRDADLESSLAVVGGESDVFAVLRPDVAIESSAAELRTLAPAIGGSRFGGDIPRLEVLPFGRAFAGPPGKFDALMIVTVTVLLLVLGVVAANVANLILARTAARSTEMAVRTALGASRSRLVGQVFLEVLTLGALAAGLGLTLSHELLLWFDRLVGADLPPWVDFGVGPTTAAFVVTATLGSSLIAGAVPAWRATRRDPASALQASGRGAAGSVGFGWISNWMVVIQMALSVALLSGALGLAQGWIAQVTVRVPIPEEHILMARLVLRPDAVVTGGADGVRAREDSVRALRAAVLLRLAETRDVVAAGGARALPRMEPRATPVQIEGGKDGAGAGPRLARVVEVSDGLFAALDARPSSGRLFAPADFAPDAPDVVVVDATFARRVLGGRNPVGVRLQLPTATDETPRWREIVGVVPDLGMNGSDPSIGGLVYRPMGPLSAFWIAVRGPDDALGLAGPVRRAIAAVDPSIRVEEMAPIAHAGWDARAFFLGIGSSLLVLGGVTLLLAAAGMYAILSFAVSRRTREIGVRLAVGASRSDVLSIVLGRTVGRLVLGAGLGWVLALALDRVRASFNGLPRLQGWTLPTVTGIMLAAGLAAALMPTKRALEIRPMDALRSD